MTILKTKIIVIIIIILILIKMMIILKVFVTQEKDSLKRKIIYKIKVKLIKKKI